MEIYKMLLSAFIGAGVALLLKMLYDYNQVQKKRKNYRCLLEKNINDLLIPKLNILTEDYNKIFFIINATNKEQYLTAINMGVDEMPMFNSSLFMSLPKNEIYESLTDKNKFSDLTDAFFTIDFLRENMPMKMIKEFNQRVERHMKNKDFKDREEFFSHFFECGTIERIRIDLRKNLQARFETIKELKRQLNSLRTL